MPHAVVEFPMPIAHLSDDGRYEVHCEAGHTSTVTLNNAKFELLFEMGLSALVDKYPREAVSSFTSALERFYEFFWHVAMRKLGCPTDVSLAAWKSVAKQSERQLGMFVSAHLALTKRAPDLLNPNKEVKLRNDVIHGGYIPSGDQAADYGDAVMNLITRPLNELRVVAPAELQAVYKEFCPAPVPDNGNPETITGAVNIVGAVDVLHPIVDKDMRNGDVRHQFKRILQDRVPHRLELMSREEMIRRFPERADIIENKNQNDG